MAFCVYCGKQLADGAGFCTNCGAPVRRPSDQGGANPRMQGGQRQQNQQYQRQQSQNQQYQRQQNQNQQYQRQQSQNQQYQRQQNQQYYNQQQNQQYYNQNQNQQQYYNQNQQYYNQQPSYQPPASPVMGQLSTSRGLLKFILLSAITFGIYGLIVMSSVSTDINIIASRHDGRKTMHYLLVVFIFSWLTWGIVPLVWFHNISDRIGNELRRRGIAYEFGASTFWLWAFLGSLLLFVGPFVYYYKLFKAMNLLSEHYNVYG